MATDPPARGTRRSPRPPDPGNRGGPVQARPARRRRQGRQQAERHHRRGGRGRDRHRGGRRRGGGDVWQRQARDRLRADGKLTEQDAQEITTAFIQAWKTGDLNQAARYTDRPAIAQGALAGYRKTLHLRKLTGTAQSAAPVSGGSTRESVTFALNATVASGDDASALHGSWSYHSKLTAYPETGLQSLVHRLGPRRPRAQPHQVDAPSGDQGRPAGGRGERRQRERHHVLPGRWADPHRQPAGEGGAAGPGSRASTSRSRTDEGKPVENGRGYHRAEQHREPHHHDRSHGRGRGARRRGNAPQELDGRHPALHRQDPGHRQQRRLQRLRADRQRGAGLHHEGHHFHRPDQFWCPVRVERGRLPASIHGAGIASTTTTSPWELALRSSRTSPSPATTRSACSGRICPAGAWPTPPRSISASTSPGTSASPASPAPTSTPRPAPAALSWRRRRSARDS